MQKINKKHLFGYLFFFVLYIFLCWIIPFDAVEYAVLDGLFAVAVVHIVAAIGTFLFTMLFNVVCFFLVLTNNYKRCKL